MSDVAIVMITRNRRDDTLADLERLRSLPEHPPVVVVDNGSEDATSAAVGAAFPDVQLITLDRNLGAAARNVGVAAAATPYVAFADDDSWWEPGALTRAAAVLDRYPRVALVAGRVRVGDERRTGPASEQMANSALPTDPDVPYPSVLGFVACGAVVRRRPFLDVGGFSAALGVGGEERLLSLDLAVAGWSLVYVEDVVAVHEPSTASRPGRRRRMIRNDLWTAWMRRSPWSVVRQTASTVVASLHDPAARGGLLDAATGLRHVLRARHRVPPEIEARLRLID